MKTKKILILACCAVLAAFILGVTGALNLSMAQNNESARMVGMLITRESLQDAAGNAWDPEEGCVYASPEDTVITDPETGDPYTERHYIFGAVNGLNLLLPLEDSPEGPYRGSDIDPAFTNCDISLNTSDNGEDIRVEAKLWVIPDAADTVFWFNPVYQLSGGTVYAVPGDFMSFEEMTAGSSFGMSLSDQEIRTSDGKETSRSFEASVSICATDLPVKVFIAQFDGNDTLVSKMEYAPDALPETLRPEANAEYIILETVSLTADRTQTVNRSLYQKEDDYLVSFCPGEGNICLPVSCEILWD